MRKSKILRGTLSLPFRNQEYFTLRGLVNHNNIEMNSTSKLMPDIERTESLILLPSDRALSLNIFIGVQRTDLEALTMEDTKGFIKLSTF